MPHLSASVSARAVVRLAAYLTVFVAALSASFSSHAAMAFIEGEATYLERIMPPPGATLVVTLQNATRADAAAIEHASTSIRLSSGPPYAWRLAYDTQLGEVQQLSVRARIITPAGLWMSTDTFVSAAEGSTSTPMRLRLVAVGAAKTATAVSPGSAASGAATTAETSCANPVFQAKMTQADMNRCAFEEFEEAGSGYAQRYSELSKNLPSAQRDRLRRMQSAWIKFRTEACRYESGPVTGGRLQETIYWRCAARMTRERTSALLALANCREGDVTCTRRAP